ncbi:MAG: hypothetical protein AVDCRST_MAG11-175, partial [uncultured Gemmatimonadaceae bacterium]
EPRGRARVSVRLLGRDHARAARARHEVHRPRHPRRRGGARAARRDGLRAGVGRRAR